MRNFYQPYQYFTGNGLLSTYNFAFKITEAQQLLYIILDSTSVEVSRHRGDDVGVNVQFDEDLGGGQIILPAPLPLNYKLLIYQADDVPLQTYRFRNKGSFTQERIEAALDWLSGQIQRLTFRMGRAMGLSDADVSGFNPTLPPMQEAGGRIPVVSDDGLSWAPVADWFDLSGFIEAGGSGGVLELPTDGKFGGPGGGATGTAGSVSGIDAGDKQADAFDKMEMIFEKLAPAKPLNVSATVLSISGSYAARQAGTGTSTPVVIDSTSPQIAHAVPAFDGDAGVLSADIDSVEVGTHILTTADDTGTYGQLQILSDGDPYAGQAGKEGFWKGFTSRINAVALTVGMHLAELKHTTTGTASLNFGVDNPGSPTTTITSAVGSGTGRYISGVPSLATGDLITAGVSIAGAVSAFYNALRIGNVSSTVANSVDIAPPGSPPNTGDTLTASVQLTIAANRYSEGSQVAAYGTNSKGVNGTTTTLTSAIRVDTVSNESARVSSSTGQYPAAGYGAAWVPGDLLSVNKELQMLNGLFQYPPLTNYSGNLPVAGPNYSGLTPDSYANMRWVTFNLGAKSAVTSVTLNFLGAVNFGSTALISGLAMYVRVDGATPTGGWVDGNAAYPGVGNPTANGDAALDVGGSSATARRVTFGATPRTGNVIVRIGIPSGSTKRFSGMSMV